MKTYKTLRTILCIYESLRLVLLAWINLLVHFEKPNIFPLMVIIVPGTMFFLIALFLRLDLDRFRVYCPLYVAGKSLGIILSVFWIIISKISTIGEPIQFLVFLLLGEILSVWVVYIIMKDRTEAY